MRDRPKKDSPAAGSARLGRLRSGVPLLVDVEALADDPFFREMQAFSQSFLSTCRPAQRWYGRRWCADPLQAWSRRWEYPFVASRVAAFADRRSGGGLTILDAGSGVTFFPYYLTRQMPGSRVICCDGNTGYGRALARINRLLGSSDVDFANCMLQELPLPADSIDAIYCVSVLEHTDDYEAILAEFGRVLRPGGMLALTFDLSLDGKGRIDRPAARRLLDLVKSRFELDATLDVAKELDRLDRPEEILTTDYVRSHQPELLPWKHPLLKSAYDLLRGKGWSSGFFSLSCFCMEARLAGRPGR